MSAGSRNSSFLVLAESETFQICQYQDQQLQGKNKHTSTFFRIEKNTTKLII